MEDYRLLVAVFLITISMSVRQGSCEGGKGLVCDSYHIDKGIFNGTETCKNVGDSCFVLWGEEQNERNETLHRVIRKGCFQISVHKPSDHCQDDCIQNPDYDAFKSENVSGFCCCNKDMCNINFTAVDYEEYESTIAPTTSNGSCERGNSTKELVCEFYYPAEEGFLNGTETCKTADDRCMVLWGEEQNERNETLYRVFIKGCYLMQHPSHYCQDVCIQPHPKHGAYFKTEHVTGFCCCSTDMCNVNFTAVDYEDNLPTVPPPTEKCNGSCEEGNSSKELVCDYYYQTDEGIQNKTETCKNADDSCVVFWGEEQNERNETLYRVLMKGCFQIPKLSGFCPDTCNQPSLRHKSYDSKLGTGFCCCNKNMCNANITAVDYKEYDTPVAPTAKKCNDCTKPQSNKSIIIVAACASFVVLVVIVTLVLVYVYRCKHYKGVGYASTGADHEENELSTVMLVTPDIKD